MADIDLIDADQIYDYANYTQKQPDDELIKDLITQVSMVFANFCGIEQFKSKEYIEYYDGDGLQTLFLDQYPVIKITSINDDNQWVYDADTLIASTDYKIVNQKYVVLKDIVFSNGSQNIKIVYTAGYSSIPNDIQLACIKETDREFRRKGEQDITGRSLNDGSVSYTEKGLLTSTKEILNAYVKRVVY